MWQALFFKSGCNNLSHPICPSYNVTLPHGEVGSMFPYLESWLTCDYGGSDGRTSKGTKAIELLPGSSGTLAHGTLSPYPKEGLTAPGEAHRERNQGPLLTQLSTQLTASTIHQPYKKTILAVDVVASSWACLGHATQSREGPSPTRSAQITEP